MMFIRKYYKSLFNHLILIKRKIYLYNQLSNSIQFKNEWICRNSSINIGWLFSITQTTLSYINRIFCTALSLRHNPTILISFIHCCFHVHCESHSKPSFAGTSSSLPHPSISVKNCNRVLFSIHFVQVYFPLTVCCVPTLFECQLNTLIYDLFAY